MLKAAVDRLFQYDQPIETLKGIGPQTLKRLHKLNLYTFRDMLFHLPIRYEDRTRLTPIASLKPSLTAQIQGQVKGVQVHRARKKWLSMQVSDKSGSIDLVLFHFSQKQVDVLMKKPWIRCYGQITQKVHVISMVHPQIKFLKGPDEPVDEMLTPIYPTTQGLHQTILRQSILSVLSVFEDTHQHETLPFEIREHFDLIDFKDALLTLHRPSPQDSLERLLDKTHAACRRLIVEEIYAHFVVLKGLRMAVCQEKALPLPSSLPALKVFKSQLSFELTRAQDKAFSEIEKDLCQETPMMRLVQGDVGSGKTVVAALACLVALSNHTQAALLAPTEILAQQHYIQLHQWFEPLGFEVILLSGKAKAKEKRALLEKIATQSPLMVVGTHALFQESVVFKDLSLMVVDEQHRFGVHQRMQLKLKGQHQIPHQLVMTATPIPRTLAMTRYADLDLTVIDELPPGRKEIKTICVQESSREDVIQRIDEVISQGQQIYWVCPLIEESEKLDFQAAQLTYEHLKTKLKSVGLVHGRMKNDEKESIMEAFKANKIKVLVATTVIEVGVNVPNATLMVIENAERLGLAQLHQLRGRVGRGALNSYCVLIYKSPLSPHAKKRLEVMRETNDGFKIAQMDLEIRGPGEVLGVRQTGLQAFRVADIFRDQTLIDQCYTLSMQSQITDTLTDTLSMIWFGDKKDYQQV